MLRKGAMTSLVATELGFVGFLWVIWLGECFRAFWYVFASLSHPPNFLQHAAPTPLPPSLASALVIAACTIVSSRCMRHLVAIPR